MWCYCPIVSVIITSWQLNEDPAGPVQSSLAAWAWPQIQLSSADLGMELTCSFAYARAHTHKISSYLIHDGMPSSVRYVNMHAEHYNCSP